MPRGSSVALDCRIENSALRRHMVEALAKDFFYRISQSNSESERPAVDGSASITRRQRSVVVVGEARELRPKRSIRGVPSLAAPSGAAVFR